VALTERNLEADLLDQAKNIEHRSYQLWRRLPWYVSYTDLRSAAIEGVIDASRRFDKKRNTKFSTYAETRMIGSMIDSLRVFDWVPRSQRKRERRIRNARKELQQRLGRRVSDPELADAMGLTVDTLHEWQRRSLRYNGPVPSSVAVDGPSPLDLVESADEVRLLADALLELTDRERQVMVLYYFKDLTMKQAAKRLNITESRVCQLHAKAVVRLRLKLQGWLRDAIA
jgi:RNA polymerase sigma factor for flagellar operon FliA